MHTWLAQSLALDVADKPCIWADERTLLCQCFNHMAGWKCTPRLRAVAVDICGDPPTSKPVPYPDKELPSLRDDERCRGVSVA